MSQQELLAQLRPEHFSQGETFDPAVFAAMIADRQKLARDAWKLPVIWVVFFAMGALAAAKIGGAIGNGLGVVGIFLGMILGNLALLGTARRLKAAYKTLGIKGRDVNDALKALKKSGDAPVATAATAATVATATAAPAAPKAATSFWQNFVFAMPVGAYIFVILLSLANIIDAIGDLWPCSVIILLALIGLAGAWRVRKKEWSGALLALIPIVGAIVASLLWPEPSAYKRDFLTIAAIFTFPLLILAVLAIRLKKSAAPTKDPNGLHSE